MLQFIDTSTFYAIEDHSDQCHKSAIEYDTLIKDRLGYELAIKFGKKLRESKVLNKDNLCDTRVGRKRLGIICKV